MATGEGRDTAALIYDWNEKDRRGPVFKKTPRLVDETIRDGLQSPSVTDPTIEQKMEALLTTPIASLASDSDQVDARGVADAEGLYAREWTITSDGETTAIELTVTWLEMGSESHSISMFTRRDL